MKNEKLRSILFYIITAEAAGGLSALITGSFKDLFMQYEEPPLMPPAIAFPIVWTILYGIMGYSAHLIATAKDNLGINMTALKIYWLQLGLNFIWSIIFFRLKLLWLAFAVIVALLLSICLMTALFIKIRPKAGYLNIPYILWVAFATYLNLATALQ